jgi:alcohol dehydrogenase
MKEFIYENQVKLIYGENNIGEVINEIKKYGSKVLLVIGGSSFNKNGYYKAFTESLKKENIDFINFSGHKYPSLQKVREGIEICRKETVDCVLGIGGGTCMDVAKTIAFGVKQEHDIWEYLIGAYPTDGSKHLPVGTIVTYPSSGSEMDGATQITDDETRIQVGLSGVYPDFSWINPEYIMSLDNNELAYGQITSFVQISISYLGLERSTISEALAATLMKEILSNLEKAMNNTKDRESRGSMMITSALNVSGIINLGKDGDWSIYPLEGIIQNYYDVNYTRAITIIFPYWLKHIYGGQKIFKSYFKNVLNLDVENKSDEEVLQDGLNKIFEVYRKFNIATKFSGIKEVAMNENELREIIESIGEVPSQYGLFTYKKIKDLIIDSIYGIDK